ncbi:FUSC family protein [Methylobacterium sp. PvR107]|uniref:FUSC family protein n=1 Tax=Methylobacterium sp. PvR107 TaxID=2806597 RepID=UPI001B505BAC|nr:FUSC family protein [Methylobacterium sp. PvR107]MBP1179337.1 putative membrane protein YccC [Methylobacterium sp. PvR107]
MRIALTAIAAVWLAMWLELVLPHWAGWTVISVTLATRAASLRKSLWRAGSTLVGVTVAMVLVANFAQATLAFDRALALWMGLFTAASSVESGQRAYGFASMGFTVPIIALADVQHPETVFKIGVDRCSTILVGVVLRYTLLTTTGNFALLAAVLLPVAMLAVVGRADKRAIYGIGFGFFVFGVLDPKNPMTYDLEDSLNTVLAELLGMAMAAIAFSALPPPVSAAKLRLRARDRYLARGFGRLALIGADDAAARSGKRLLVIGLLLLALRETDDRQGRRVGRAVWARLAAPRFGAPDPSCEPLREFADRATLPLQAERIGALAALVSDLDRAGWPILDPEVRACSDCGRSMCWGSSSSPR